MSEPHPCPVCEAALNPATGEAVCAGCAERAHVQLAWLRDTAGELAVTISRQDVIVDDRPAPVVPAWLHAGEVDQHGRQLAGTARTMALPFRWEAAEVAAEVQATLGSWCRLVHEERHPQDYAGELLPQNTGESMAGYLVAELPWWVLQGWADDLVREVAALSAAVEAAVDRREAQVYLGACQAVLSPLRAAWGPLPAVLVEMAPRCPVHLYAEPGAAWVRCPGCHTQHEVAVRRAWLLGLAEDHLAHAELIAGALSGLGLELSVDRVRKWAQRGHLVLAGTDTLGRKVYRVGDAVDLALTMKRGRKPKAAQSASSAPRSA